MKTPIARLARPGLRELEVQDLHPAVGCHLHVGGLQVAVDDSLLVRFLEGLGDLPRDGVDGILHMGEEVLGRKRYAPAS